jgi:hypothetical protein
MTTLSEEWALYRARVVPPDAGAVQVAETEQAFYSGAVIAFQFVVEKASALPEDDAVAELQRLRDELRAYAARKVAG